MHHRSCVRKLLAAWIGLAVFSLPVSAQEARKTRPPNVIIIYADDLGDSLKEITAIRRVLDDQVIAWNKGDLNRFMAGYWKSPALSFYSGGKKTKGWQATLDRYRKKYQGAGKEMGKLAFEELAIDLLGSEHALVRGRWQLTLAKGKAAGLFTVIFRKTNAGWRIIHDHTSAETP